MFGFRIPRRACSIVGQGSGRVTKPDRTPPACETLMENSATWGCVVKPLPKLYGSPDASQHRGEKIPSPLRPFSGLYLNYPTGLSRVGFSGFQPGHSGACGI